MTARRRRFEDSRFPVTTKRRFEASRFPVTTKRRFEASRFPVTTKRRFEDSLFPVTTKRQRCASPMAPSSWRQADGAQRRGDPSPLRTSLGVRIQDCPSF
jgi:hypothetical protein